MNLFKASKIKESLKYLLPSLITAAVFCTVLLIKGIYPFGADTIDFYDLSDQGTPIYLHIYDAVHGHKNLFYDVYSALTTNMTGMLGTSGISPFNLFFLFIKRESVLKCMSVFLLLKLVVMSFGMYLFLDKAVKADYFYKVIFSVSFSFSGFILLHYTSHIWFDNVAYFPFVMAGLYELIKNGKYMLYTVSLSLSLICGYYISFLFFIYIFLMLGIYIIVNKAFRIERNYHLPRLLLCTVASLLISAFILIPQLYQTLSSARFSNESGGGLLNMYTGILENVTPAYTSRWFNILGVSFAAAVIIAGLIKYWRDERLTVITIGSVLIICAELLFENINLFWHYGSYVHYPLRNGFMIGFTLSFLACLYIGKMSEEAGSENKAGKAGLIPAVIFALVCIALTAVAMLIYYKNPSMSQRSVLHMLGVIMEICAVVYIILIMYRGGKYIRASAVLILCEFIFYGFVFLGKPTYITGYTEEPEMERDSIYICNQLYDEFKLGDIDPSKRIKNPDESLNSNYALVLKRSALSNWTALISPKLQESAKRLGYTIQYTRLLDSGGTVFSDALIGVHDIVSCVPQDEKLYSLQDSADVVVNRETGEIYKYYYYKCKYELPWGIMLHSIDNIDFDEDDVVKLYNSIYSSIMLPSGELTDGDIASYIELSDYYTSDDKSNLKQEITINGHKAVYYFADQVDTDDYNTTISVNGSIIGIPSISEKDNTLYPAHFNNNAVYLGTFNNEDIALDIQFSHKDKNGNEIASSFKPKAVAIDIDKLTELCNAYKDYDALKNHFKTRYELSADMQRDGYLMLPLSYDRGYRAWINGQKTDVQLLGGLFMAVPVLKGHNDIIIKFSPTGLFIGIIISVSALIAAACFYRFFRSRTFKRCALIENIYVFVWCAAIVLMYIVPAAYSLGSLL